jgi:hypothetical protein
MQFMIVGPRLPTPVLDHRSASERAADAIAAIDEAITTPSERAERALRRIDKALRGRRTPGSTQTTPCWFCGNPLAPNEVGLPCPVCDDGNGIAEAPPTHVLDALARARAEHGWRTARNKAWHNWYETAVR